MFMIYLTSLIVSLAVQHQMIRIMVNHKLEPIRQETVMTYIVS